MPTRSGLELRLTAAEPIELLQAYDADGRLLWLERDLPPSALHFVPISIDSGSVRLVIDDREHRLPIAAPDGPSHSERDPVTLRIALPLGTEPAASAELRGSARTGSRPRILAVVDYHPPAAPAPTDPPAASPAAPNTPAQPPAPAPRLRLTGACNDAPDVLWDGPRPAEPGDALLLAAPTLPPVPPEGLRCRIRVLDESGETRARASLIFESHDRPPPLSLAALHLPADRFGEPDPARPRDTLRLPDLRFRALRTALGLGGPALSLDGVRGHAAVRVRNDGDTAATALVRVLLLDPASGEPAPDFRPRAVHTDTGAEAAAVLLQLPPGAEVPALLPLHASRRAQPGPLLLRAELSALGEAAPLDSVERRITVERSHGALWTAFFAVLLFAAAGLAWSASRWRRWTRPDTALPTESAVFAALIGALLAVYHTGAYVASSLFFTLLGPLDVFFMGSLGALVQALLLTVLVLRSPRPGVVSLTWYTSAALRGLVGGHLGPAELLFAAVGATVTEACLWLSGPTRGRPALPRLMLALGVAGAAVQGLNLLIYRVLFRLDFALWYVAAVMLVLGLFAALPGVLLGSRLSRDLSKVSP